MTNKLYVINSKEGSFNTFILQKNSDINEIKLISRDNNLNKIFERNKGNVNLCIFESSNKTVINIKLNDS